MQRRDAPSAPRCATLFLATLLGTALAAGVSSVGEGLAPEAERRDRPPAPTPHAMADDGARDRLGPWVDEIGTPQYFAVLVRDLESAVEWYTTALGVEEWLRSKAEDGSWRIVNLRSESLLVELIRDDRARTVDRAHGLFKVGFHVPDVDTVAERVERATGDQPRISEFPRFGLRVLQLRDPEGNVIQLHDGRT